MHTMSAQNLIVDGCVNCSQDIVAIRIAVVSMLDDAKWNTMLDFASPFVSESLCLCQIQLLLVSLPHWDVIRFSLAFLRKITSYKKYLTCLGLMK
jgi:hypothetical protein